MATAIGGPFSARFALLCCRPSCDCYDGDDQTKDGNTDNHPHPRRQPFALRATKDRPNADVACPGAGEACHCVDICIQRHPFASGRIVVGQGQKLWVAIGCGDIGGRILDANLNRRLKLNRGATTWTTCCLYGEGGVAQPEAPGCRTRWCCRGDAHVGISGYRPGGEIQVNPAIVG